MHLLAKQTVARLLASTGHTLTIDDFDDLDRMHRAAERVSTPIERDEHDFVEAPIHVKGVRVRFATLGDLWWIDRKFGQWFDDRTLSLAIAWLLTLTAPEDVLGKIEGPTEASGHVNRWWRRSGWTVTDVERVLADRFPRRRGSAVKAQPDFGPVVALLMREYGQTAEYWLYTASALQCTMLLEDCAERRYREAVAAAAPRAKGDAVRTPAPKMVALKAFKLLVEEITAKWQTK